MGELIGETYCKECKVEFDDADDTTDCNVCGSPFCESCQADHAVIHCFNDVDTYEHKLKSLKGKKKK